VLAFCDADTRMNPTALGRAYTAVAEHDFAAAGAAVHFDRQASVSARLAGETWNLIARLMRWVAGSFVVVRREMFDAVGGFDDRFYAAEELVLSGRLKRLGPIAIVK